MHFATSFCQLANALWLVDTAEKDDYRQVILPVSYTHLDVYKRQAYNLCEDEQLLNYPFGRKITINEKQALKHRKTAIIIIFANLSDYDQIYDD